MMFVWFQLSGRRTTWSWSVPGHRSTTDSDCLDRTYSSTLYTPKSLLFPCSFYTCPRCSSLRRILSLLGYVHRPFSLISLISQFFCALSSSSAHSGTEGRRTRREEIKVKRCKVLLYIYLYAVNVFSYIYTPLYILELTWRTCRLLPKLRRKPTQNYIWGFFSRSCMEVFQVRRNQLSPFTST